MRKFRLYDNAKVKYIDLNNQNNFAKNWQGLGLNNDLAFTNSDNGEYLDNLKVANKDIKSIISFNGYSYYDKFKSFILANGKNNFVLEYLSHTDYKTQEEIALKDETIEVENGDDEYFVHVPLVSKYSLKPETVPFTETPSYPDITYKNYAEVKLIQGSTQEVNALLESVTNPLVKIVNDNILDITLAELGKSLSTTDGSETTYTYSLISPFVKVDSNKFYMLHGLNSTYRNFVVYYDSDYNFINRTSPQDVTQINFTTPSNALYIRFTYYDLSSSKTGQQLYDLIKDTVMLNTGTTPLPYVAHESTQAQFNGTFRQWDSLKVVNGVYKKDNGSSDKILFNGSGTWTLAHTYTNTLVFLTTVSSIKPNGGIVSNRFTSALYGDRFNDVEQIMPHDTLDDRLFVQINKSKLTSEDATGFKTWLSNNNLELIYQKATVMVEDVVMDGGLDLIPNGNIFVSDDNNLLTSATLQYKRWNLSNIIRKTNLKKFTISGDDLVIYLLASDVDNLTGATIIDKIITYFMNNESYVNILLDEYVKTETYKYRDVYVRELSKGEKNAYGQIESNFTLTPNKGWYIEHSTDYNVPLTVADGTQAFFEVNINGVNSRAPMIIKLSSQSSEFKPELMIKGTEFDSSNYKISQILFDNTITYFTSERDILTIDSLNRKITLYNNMYSTEENYYDYTDKNYDSFPYVFSKALSVLFYSDIAVTSDTTVSITITYREWV